MSIEFRCTNSDCGQLVQADNESAGTQMVCPHCRTMLQGPLAATERLERDQLGATVIPTQPEEVHDGDATLIEPVSANPVDDATLIETDLPITEGEVAATYVLESQLPAGSVVATSRNIEKISELTEYLNAKRQGEKAPFDVERTLAEGGMGAVLIGRDQALQRRVAVKVIKPEIASSIEHRVRFLEEAQITGQLEHPNIVPIHDLGKNADGDLYFSMKLVKGQSLGEIVKGMSQSGQFDRSLTELLSIFLKVCDGMAFAHSKGVVHRDLKPDNIMVGDFGEVLVMDWGLAKIICGNSTSPGPQAQSNDQHSSVAEQVESNADIDSVRATASIAQTMAGTIQGTPAYMPPEQAKGEIDRIDYRADIYSLGAILYEILTLKRPIEGENVLAIVKNVWESNVIPPDERTPDRWIPKELSAVVMKAMQPEPEDRYQTVKELERDITLFLEGRAVSAKDDSVFESLVKLVRRNKALSSAIGVAATIIIVLASVSYIRITDERDRAIKNEERAVAGEEAAKENEDRALKGEREARENEEKAVFAQNTAVAAQQKQRETALAASKRFALQVVEQANVNRLEAAERRASDAELVAPFGPWADFAAGAIAMARVDYAKATKFFEKAAANADGDEPEIHAALAESLALQGNLKDAESLLADLDSIDDWRIVMSAGRALYAAHKWDVCQKPLQRAIELMNMEADRPEDNVREAEQLVDAVPAQKACEGFYEEVRHLPVDKLQQQLINKFEEIHGKRINNIVVRGDMKSGLYAEITYQGDLKYVYPLRNLPITEAKLNSSSVWDISPLKGMQLTKLSLWGSRPMRDLSPLAGMMTLESLSVSETNVSDLTPLTGLKLKRLGCRSSKVRDLAPLEGMPLEYLDCWQTAVSDLTPLQGMPLKDLYLGSRASDLSPLKGMPLEVFVIGDTGTTLDLSPLNGMKLVRFDCGNRVNTLEPLRGMPLERLRLVNVGYFDAYLPEDYYEPLAGMPLKHIEVSNSVLRDLSFLSNSPVEYLDLTRCRNIESLEPISGLPIKQLGLWETWIRDLTPLATLEQIDTVRCPWVPYLLGKTTDEEFEAELRTPPLMNDPVNTLLELNKDNAPKVVQWFKMEKLIGEGRLAEALKVLEDYDAKWGIEKNRRHWLGLIRKKLTEQDGDGKKKIESR